MYFQIKYTVESCLPKNEFVSKKYKPIIKNELKITSKNSEIYIGSFNMLSNGNLYGILQWQY